MNGQYENDLFITDDFDSCWAFCGSIHNVPRNDSILLLMDRFNVSSLYGNLVLKLAKFLCQFFGEGPQFAVVVEYTCNVCIDISDVDCVADFSAVKKYVFSVLKESIARLFSAVDVIVHVISSAYFGSISMEQLAKCKRTINI